MSHEYKQVASEGSPCLGRFCRNHAKGAPRPGPEEGLKGHPPPLFPPIVFLNLVVLSSS